MSPFCCCCCCCFGGKDENVIWVHAFPRTILQVRRRVRPVPLLLFSLWGDTQLMCRLLQRQFRKALLAVSVKSESCKKYARRNAAKQARREGEMFFLQSTKLVFRENRISLLHREKSRYLGRPSKELLYCFYAALMRPFGVGGGAFFGLP